MIHNVDSQLRSAECKSGYGNKNHVLPGYMNGGYNRNNGKYSIVGSASSLNGRGGDSSTGLKHFNRLVNQSEFATSVLHEGLGMVRGDTEQATSAHRQFINGKLLPCETAMQSRVRSKTGTMAEQGSDEHVYGIPFAQDYVTCEKTDKLYANISKDSEINNTGENAKFGVFYNGSVDSLEDKSNADLSKKICPVSKEENRHWEKDDYLMKSYYSTVPGKRNSWHPEVGGFKENYVSAILNNKPRHSISQYELKINENINHSRTNTRESSVDTISGLQYRPAVAKDYGESSCHKYGNKYKYTHSDDFDSVNDHELHASRPYMTRSLSYSVDGRQESRSVRIRDIRSHSFSPAQDDGIMSSDREEGAINLCTEVKLGDMGTHSTSTNSPNSIANGENEQNSQGLSSPQADLKYQPSSVAGAAKRKTRPSSDIATSSSDPLSPSSNGVHQSVLMLAAQHGLTPQQIQQMLVTQQSVVPSHLQQMMQAQQSIVMQQQQKAQEQALLQLNEQLQLNMLQQSQLLQEKKTNGKHTQQQLQQLGQQQQQLVQQIQQLQLQQRQFLLACLMQPFSAQQGVLSSVDMHQMWKDVAAAQSRSDDEIKGAQNGLGTMNSAGLPGGNPLFQGSMLGMNGLAHDAFPFAGHLIGQPGIGIKEEDGFNPLYRHGVCKWPGCDREYSDLFSFTKHLNYEHKLDDKNTAQARVQMQIVSQLEIQLTREKELLHAMMQHLHHHRDSQEQRERERERENERKMSENALASPMPTPVSSPMKPASNNLPVSSSKTHRPLSSSHMSTSGLPPLIIPPQSSLTSATSQPGSLPPSQPATPTGLGPMRRRVSDKCNLPISAEIQRNREFYKNTDVRPPFTYASLIRQAIIESDNRQLTLNEVYQWFQTTFAYFRRNEATWKNAVRHNLSLHKCFMRVENVKGAVWTVDEIEFYKRRPQKLTGAISGSPSVTPESSMYGESMNNSLRAALEQSSMLMSQNMSNGSMLDWGAEDLSMKSHNNSNDSFPKSESPQRDDSVFMKPESLSYQEEEVDDCSPQDYSSSQGLDLSPRGASQQQSPPGSQSQQSPKGNLSPVDPYSPQTKQYMMDPRVTEPMDVRLMRPEGRYVSHGPFIGREHESVKYDVADSNMQFSAHNFKMDQLEAINMKKVAESEDKDKKREMDTSRPEEHNLEHFDSPEENGDDAELNGDEEEINDYNTARVDDDLKQNSIRGSQISSSQDSRVEQKMTNQDLYSPLLQHQNKMVVVSHSMS